MFLRIYRGTVPSEYSEEQVPRNIPRDMFLGIFRGIFPSDICGSTVQDEGTSKQRSQAGEQYRLTKMGLLDRYWLNQSHSLSLSSLIFFFVVCLMFFFVVKFHVHVKMESRRLVVVVFCHGANRRERVEQVLCFVVLYL
ncbi:hypothetical protein DY000_02008797 [Brassica cretica]|uniref:Uncharacterized protein n=1 Tax=Brassica cretica TaxID=69181 RepID=A0ABQ7C7S1_BRACR|nr:hypothetical protein DY000_02008797 [Brassica cretica]